MFRKTKIVCTIGPASNNEEMVEKLFNAGMNASRHNFSHGTHETHKENFELVKRVGKKLSQTFAIILDTKGPEIRTGDFENNTVNLKEGEEITIVSGETVLGNEKEFSVTYGELANDVVVGNHILIDDGLIDLEVIEVNGNRIKTKILNSGSISNHKGVNLPGIKTNLPSLTEKDIDDLKFGIENNVDIIAASFIRKAEDVLAIRKVLQENGGSNIHIYSKIENQEGVDNVEEIVRYSDGIMVARGDMGVEIPLEKVPLIQKHIIHLCNKYGKPVITATQMLDSMMRNPRPTRAEVSDVANAIMDGSDAIMLSGETASGKYPFEAVSTMADIAIETESKMNYEEILTRKLKNYTNSVQDAIASAVCTTANHLEATAIITATQSGSTARNIAKFKPKSTIIATTPDEGVARKLSLNWGVYPIISNLCSNTDEMIENSTKVAKERGFICDGDLVVLSAGIPLNYMGSTNMMKIHLIGDVLLKGKSQEQTTEVKSGRAVFARDLLTAREKLREGDILVTKQVLAEFSELLDMVSGIVAETGIVDPQVQVEAFKKAVPIIYSADDVFRVVKENEIITIDGVRSVVIHGKTKKENLQNINKVK